MVTFQSVRFANPAISVVRYRVAVVMLAGVLLLAACGSDGPVAPSELPPLADAIPYDALGSGRIAFSRVGPSGEYEGIYVVDIDERRSWSFDLVRRQTGSIDFITVDYLSLSPDGSRIAFHGGIWPYIANVDGNDITRLGLPDGGSDPGWSPDGARLYFWGKHAGCGLEDAVLYAQAPGSGEQGVASAPLIWAGGPSVAPSGSVLFGGAYCAEDGSPGEGGIMVIEEGADESRMLIPSDSVGQFSPVWSPDGARIAYLEGNVDSVAVVVTDAVGGSKSTIFRAENRHFQMWSGHDWTVAWSPDGTKLLFTLNEADFESHVYVINADGSGLRAVTTLSGASDTSPSWSR